MTTLPSDYAARVYAGVLGKIIGVYLGRPFEGWAYERIMQELGEVLYYVHEKCNVPLIVTDDDISGTFTFLRALPDYDNRRELTPAQIGQTWLNYIIEQRTILWWGGMGMSTEHTAYLRLKNGIPAPQSGSSAMNGKVVAEQIGSQIFIDGWAMVAPGDPEFAADLARRAASVSHDGEAIYGAQVVAALEAQAFVERDLNKLLDVAVALIPNQSLIYRMIGQIRAWHAAQPDWRKTRALIAAHYGYDKYGGGCHMIPNHALIIHALLHGDDDFQKSLMIVNTCGWDTDCNAGNVGCILGIKNGLAGIDAGPDWRGPVADRMYLATADGGRAITDALTESCHIVNIGRALAGEPPLTPKNGARFHFELPGAVQGFMSESSPDAQGVATVEQAAGHSRAGAGSLAIHYRGVAPGRSARVATPTFIPSRAVSDYFIKRGYALHASPTLYSGQTVRAAVAADAHNPGAAQVSLYVTLYQADDSLGIVRGPQQTLAPGDYAELSWTIPATNGLPISAVGCEVTHPSHANGTIYLDTLTWDGAPDIVLANPGGDGAMWRRAWVNGVDQFDDWWPEAYRLMQNRGRGLLSQGTREWQDYTVRATLTLHLAKAAGLAVRVQGMQRYYALLLCNDGTAKLIKALDGDAVLAERAFPWTFGASYAFALTVRGHHIEAMLDGRPLFAVEDADRPLDGGGVALVVEEGRIMCDAVAVAPA
ncbi:ADP-ribosylglycohydrolase family protein [Caldilinea sp.]|uniref:ADP-ribosylglycohydrolase family protein n=1 Tax=Caldilinea sp. TaxID=2293560 RepID=UPI002BD4DC27|nr:ADP-ribosylglycohydrolase family protein [Anaerolineales bacterium]HQY94343.1 ADP-ribosylglycohydrolase family protein [Caldilinea sp.]